MSTNIILFIATSVALLILAVNINAQNWGHATVYLLLSLLGMARIIIGWIKEKE